MAFQATVIKVLIASPSDTLKDRDGIETAIHRWNTVHADTEKVVLLPVRWERAAVPEMGRRPQEGLNEQLLTTADVVIGVFWHRVGTETGVERSGTIEEIKVGLDSGKEVLLYFCDRAISPSVIDQSQYAEVSIFRKWAQDKSIYQKYKSSANLQIALFGHLSTVVERIKQKSTGVVPSVKQAPTKIRTKYPKVSSDLVESDLRSLIKEQESRMASSLNVGSRLEKSNLAKKKGEEKACVFLKNTGRAQVNEGEVIIALDMVNSGTAVARNIEAEVRHAGEVKFADKLPILLPGKSSNLSWKMERGNPGESKGWEFTVILSWFDGNGKDFAEHDLYVAGKDTIFSVYEDMDAAKVSTPCRPAADGRK